MADAPTTTPADTIAAAIAARTAADKQIATAELPLLQQAQEAVNNDLQAVVAKLKPVADALGPGNSAALIKQIIALATSASGALANDISNRTRTLGQ